MHRIPHSTYYQDRCSEYELCHDFPGDEILIDGLHAMQCHFRSNHVAIDIPVVRVMNTAHFLASYMFSTECSGDRLEYDAMAHNSMGRDRQLVPLTMIVLAAMLQRTTGFRAKQCRNVILENRDPDFEEGVTLYDRFLRSAEKHFAEEDFLIDTQVQIVRLKEEITKVTTENIQLKYTIIKMENQHNKQYNNCVIYNAPVYNTSITNNNYAQSNPSSNEPEQAQKEPIMEEKPASDLFCRITQEAYDKGVAQEVEDELRSACVSAPKLVKAIRTNEALGYLDTKNLTSKELYDMLNEHFGLPFKVRTFQDNRRI